MATKTEWQWIGASELYRLWSNGEATDEELEEVEMTKEDYEWLLEHAYMCESEGGYDGDGRNALDVLLDNHIDKGWLARKLAEYSVNLNDYLGTEYDNCDNLDMALYRIFTDELEPDTCEAAKILVRSWNYKVMDKDSVRGTAFWNDGYTSPQIILFDEDSPIVDEIIKNVQPS